MDVNSNKNSNEILNLLKDKVGFVPTLEQADIITSTESNILVEACPGAGKSTTLLLTLFFRELSNIIPLKRTLVCAFNKDCASEFMFKFQELKSKFGVVDESPMIKTIDAIAWEIVDTYGGIYPAIPKLRDNKFEDDPLITLEIAQKIVNKLKSADPDMTYILSTDSILKAIKLIDKYNSGLKFSIQSLDGEPEFEQLGMPVNVFNNIRALYLKESMRHSRISHNDITLLALEILEENKEVADSYKEKYDITYVDEFQDLSTLNLSILNAISNKMMFVGDMNQQIYRFRGASQNIVSMIRDIKPDVKIYPMSKTNRCGQDIIRVANEVIDLVGGKPFTSFRRNNTNNTKVQIISGTEAQYAKQELLDFFLEKSTKGRLELNKHMILYRNNFSALEIIYMLTRKGVPIRINKPLPLYQIPVVGLIARIMNLITTNSKLVTDLSGLRELLPELRQERNNANHPLIFLSRKNPTLEWYNLPYTWQDANIIDDIREVANQYKRQPELPFSVYFDRIYNIMRYSYFDKYKNTFTFELSDALDSSRYYIGEQTFDEFKMEYATLCNTVMENNKGKTGVAFHTFFTAKGLEADTVTIIDCNEGIIPSASRLRKLRADGCVNEAYAQMKADINALYVGITRAKEKLVILTSGKEAELSSVFSGEGIVQEILNDRGILVQEELPLFNTDLQIASKCVKFALGGVNR